MYAWCVTLIALGTFVVVMNWAIVIRNTLTGASSSVVGLVGGACLCLGMFLYPNGGLRLYCFIPLLLDYGCVAGWLHSAMAGGEKR